MAERPRRGDGTRVVHAGLPAPQQGAPFLPGPVLAAPYHLAGDPADEPWQYGRFHNPTWTAYESALGELEDARAVLFASGSAATSALLHELIGPGGVLVAPRDCYYGARWIAAPGIRPRDGELRLVTSETSVLSAAADGASVVWIETPANPTLAVVDVAAVAAAARSSGARVVVDNTVATALGQRPLDLGADVSVVSATKSLAGHADLVLGVLTTRDEGVAAAMLRRRTDMGAVAGPFEAWLAHRSLATLALRLERQSANALAVAGLLAERDEVSNVRYPGLPQDPGHLVAARQMTRYGPLLSFTLPDADHAQRFLTAAELVLEATSFGGVHSTAERRGRWGTDEVPAGLIRFSAGIEDGADLLADVAAALDSAAA